MQVLKKLYSACFSFASLNKKILKKMTSLYCERKLKQLFFYCPLTVSAQSRRIHVVKTMVSGPLLKARQQGQVSRALSDYHYKDEVPCQ